MSSKNHTQKRRLKKTIKKTGGYLPQVATYSTLFGIYIFGNMYTNSIITQKINKIIINSFAPIINKKNCHKSKDEVYKLYYNYDIDKGSQQIMTNKIYKLWCKFDSFQKNIHFFFEMFKQKEKQKEKEIKAMEEKQIGIKFMLDDYIPQIIYNLLRNKC
jgi:hypothetical protein